jgi:ryanodine receptor 2
MSTLSDLVIDAFGELRDQLDSVKENMESSCFICGIGKEYFDTVPHDFDTHFAKEHSIVNYM